ncbi:MAG: methyl-accepting chemotaxis protein [Anaerolineae bacterium]|nr:methyl-accepting chemotaxis protein [Anaerolineae bacterium]
MFKSLRIKMIVWIIVPIFLVLAVSTLVTMIFSVNSGRDMVNARMQETARGYANRYDNQIGSDLMVARLLAEVLEGYSSNDRQEVLDMLHHLLLRHPEGLGFDVGYEPNAFDGRDSDFANSPGHDSSGRFVPYWNILTGKPTLDPMVDYDTSDYYLIPKNTKKAVVIEPFLYEGVLLTSFMAPILNEDGSFRGVAGMDVSLQSLDEQVSQVKILQSGYAFLVSNSGIFVSYPDKKAIGSLTLNQLAEQNADPKLVDLAAAVAAGKEGSIETFDPVSKKPVAMFYAPVKTANWSLVVVAPLDEMLGSVNDLRNILLIIGILAVILLAVIVTLIASGIVKPVVALKTAVARLAEGDLNVSVDIGSKDELGQMGEAFNWMLVSWQEMAQNMARIADGDLTVSIQAKSEVDVMGNAFRRMVQNLRRAIQLLAESANSVDAASENLVKTAQQAGYATGQISTTILQIAGGINQEAESVSKTAASVEQMSRAINGVAKGAQEQAAAVGRASTATLEINTTVDMVTRDANNSSGQAEKAAEIARLGVQSAQETLGDMHSIKTRVGLSALKVEEMGKRSQQIGLIVETIDDIATQTNLLALNAAIEAARAGEHGKGFAVVADEVRKLAERSSTATREIGSLIQGIQQTVAEAVTAMNEGSSEVERGAQRAGQSGQALQNILTAIESVNVQVRQIAGAALKMREASGNLVEAMDSVSAVVEENTAATEQISASSDELSAAIENVASVSEENSAAAEQVSASASEMNNQVEAVNASAQALASMAVELRQVVNQFRL